MTINPKPGNEPDPGDMSAELDPKTGAASVSSPDLVPPEEDEAAKLGDFA